MAKASCVDLSTDWWNSCANPSKTGGFVLLDDDDDNMAAVEKEDSLVLCSLLQLFLSPLSPDNGSFLMSFASCNCLFCKGCTILSWVDCGILECCWCEWWGEKLRPSLGTCIGAWGCRLSGNARWFGTIPGTFKAAVCAVNWGASSGPEKNKNKTFFISS